MNFEVVSVLFSICILRGMILLHWILDLSNRRSAMPPDACVFSHDYASEIHRSDSYAHILSMDRDDLGHLVVDCIGSCGGDILYTLLCLSQPWKICALFLDCLLLTASRRDGVRKEKNNKDEGRIRTLSKVRVCTSRAWREGQIPIASETHRGTDQEKA